MKSNNKFYLTLAAIVVSTLIYFGVKFTDNATINSDRLVELSSVEIHPARKINISNLVDHNENVLTSSALNHHWSFVFFGFTNCPDVCPATLTQLVQINRAIRQQLDIEKNVKVFFVSVDPGRDSTKHLASYIKYFDPEFIGLSGSEEDIVAFEQQMGAYHHLGDKNSTGYYSVQHSADIFLIDPSGRLIAKFRPPMDLDLVVKQFSVFVENYSKTVT